METHSAKAVADYFVYLSSRKNVEEGISEGVTPLKLQKLLYFAQAAALSIYGTKLFSDDIEAWKYGPVVSSLYHKYKFNLNQPLVKPEGDYSSIVDPESKQILEGIWELFGKYSAGELVEITHRHSPWKDAYKEGQNQVIPVEAIRNYYKKIFVLQSDSDGEQEA